VITPLSMNRRLGQPIFFLLSVLLAWGSWLAKAEAQEQIGPPATGLSKDFRSETATVNGKLHYVRGGKDPAVIVIHGFPQDWYEYHAIMPRLAKQCTVIAIDLRGMGGDVRLFLAAGDGWPFANLVPKMADGLGANGCTHVENGLIMRAVHYVVEDQPEEVTDLIERYASPHSQ